MVRNGGAGIAEGEALSQPEAEGHSHIQRWGLSSILAAG